MSNLIVAAIPRKGHPVWDVSSEKVPHLTMLYLGGYADDGERQRMIEFIQHACNTSLERFCLTVERRGALGDQEADVLFFDKLSAKTVADFRSNLLANEELAKAYLSVDQHPEWTPHLTLGYPSKPAKEYEYEFYNVEFTQIAFWDENYDGPTVDLRDEYNMAAPLIMSTSYADALKTIDRSKSFEHFGVKGMRWGVRSSNAGVGDPDSVDAARAKATTTKIKQNKGSTKSVDNKDLEHLVNRLNLEKRYGQILAENTTRRKIKRHLDEIIDTTKKIQEIDKITNRSISKAGANLALRR